MIATFTSAEVIQIMVAMGVLFTTIGGVVVSVINANRIAKVDKKVESVEGKVNGAASAQVTKIDGLEKQVLTLIAALAETKQEAKPGDAPVSVIVENTPHNPVPTTTKKP